MKKMMIRTYSELVKMGSFIDRFNYLKLNGSVGKPTFGYDRYLNQKFYTSNEWRTLRNHIIVRDRGCDLGDSDHEILGKVIIHHMNPMDIQSLIRNISENMDPEFLICVSHATHNAIHYGDESLLPTDLVERQPGDTSPWLTNRN